MRELNVPTTAGTIYARSAGVAGAPLVLCLHGWSQRNGWHTWQPVMQPFASAGFWVVSVDMPGWGRSQSAAAGPLDDAQAQNVVIELIDGLDVEHATLMGKSWGGGLALSVALDRPERVDSLILTAPAFRDLDRLRTVRQPVLLAWAKDDPVIPFEYARTFADAIPRAELLVFETGGHSAAPKNAAEFAPRAIDFLRRSAETRAGDERPGQHMVQSEKHERGEAP